MEYPERLYPKKEYKIITQPDPSHILCRWTIPGVKLVESDNKLSEEALDDKEMPGLSTNSIPASLIEDCYIEFNKDVRAKYTTEWKEGEDLLKVENSEFKSINERGFFLIKIQDVIFEDVYPFPPNDPKSQEYQFKVYVKHKPVVTNYFHFELEVVDLRTNEIIRRNNLRGSWKRIVTASIRDQICQKAKFSLSEFDITVSSQNENPISDESLNNAQVGHSSNNEIDVPKPSVWNLIVLWVKKKLGS